MSETDTGAAAANAGETQAGQPVNAETGQPATQIVKPEEPIDRVWRDGGPMSETLSKAYDQSIARQEREEANKPDLPQTYMQGEDSADRLKSWFGLSEGERKEISSVADDINARKKDAAMFGLTLQEREAILAAERAKAPAVPADYEPITRAVKEAYADLEPQHVVQRWSDIDKFARRDAPGALRWLAGELGVDLRSLTGGPQSAPPVSQAPSANATGAIVQFLNEHADAQSIIGDITDAIQTGAFQRSGNPLADLKAAYQHVKGKRGDRKPARKGKWEDTLRSVGERIA